MNQSQRVLVAGTGKSGIAAAKLILDRGGEVLLYDGNAGLDEETVKKNFPEGAKVSLVLGEIKRSDLLGVELCIVSPGIPMDSPFVGVVDDAKIPILGEIELAYQCGAGRLACYYGNQRKDNDYGSYGRNFKSSFRRGFRGGKYRRALHRQGGGDDGKIPLPWQRCPVFSWKPLWTSGRRSAPF